MQLSGTLDIFPLRELIEMTVSSSVTGVLQVRVEDEIGQLFFEDGRPYHAVVGDCTGFDAVCRLFEEHDAMFRFIAGQVVANETLWLDPWEMIDRAEQQAQAWLRVRPRIPNLRCVPVLRSNVGAEHIHISENTWPMLAAVDGERSVEAIAQTLGMAPLDVCVALLSLLDQELITIKSPLPGLLKPRPLPSEAKPDTAQSGVGFFDRLLAEAQEQEQERRPDLTDENVQDQRRVNRYLNNRYINNR